MGRHLLTHWIGSFAFRSNGVMSGTAGRVLLIPYYAGSRGDGLVFARSVHAACDSPWL